MILCFFDRDVYPPKTLNEVFPLLTGVKMEEAEFKRIGERIVNLIRAFNVREGISRKDDTMPKRLFEEPLPDGASKGMVLDKNEFNKALDEYYKLRGWDPNGIPSTEKLVELGLADVAKELETLRQKAS
jgi:aldehyde:ferredoxin oxidoreductase